MSFPIIHTSEFDDKPRVIAIKVEEWIKGDYMDLLETSEPVPPKDFKPKCAVMDVTVFASGVYKEDGTCISETGEVPLCLTCDIREQCIYKRE